MIDYNSLLKISNSFSKGLDEKAQKFSGIAQGKNTYRTCHTLYLKALAAKVAQDGIELNDHQIAAVSGSVKTPTLARVTDIKYTK